MIGGTRITFIVVHPLNFDQVKKMKQIFVQTTFVHGLYCVNSEDLARSVLPSPAE